MIIDRSQLAVALPGYELGDKLGAGAFGLVLAARHRRLQRDVAIKVLAGEHDQAYVRFAAEARVLAGIDHPHVVRIYDYIEHDGLCLLIMELLRGGTLTQRQAGMSQRNACAVGIAVAEALACAHAQGVLHRDIKPDNVLFDTNGVLKVTDFGIAKIFEGSAATASAVAGTPVYMSPEQISGGRLGPGTDIYALGVMLYEMLAGVPPFDPAISLVERYRRQLNTTPPPPAGVPSLVADVVIRALAKDLVERQSSANAFAFELATAAERSYGHDWLSQSKTPLRFGREKHDAFESPVLGVTLTQVPQDEDPTPRPNATGIRAKPGPGQAIHGYRE